MPDLLAAATDDEEPHWSTVLLFDDCESDAGADRALSDASPSSTASALV